MTRLPGTRLRSLGRTHLAGPLSLVCVAVLIVGTFLIPRFESFSSLDGPSQLRVIVAFVAAVIAFGLVADVCVQVWVVVGERTLLVFPRGLLFGAVRLNRLTGGTMRFAIAQGTLTLIQEDAPPVVCGPFGLRSALAQRRLQNQWLRAAALLNRQVECDGAELKDNVSQGATDGQNREVIHARDSKTWRVAIQISSVTALGVPAIDSLRDAEYGRAGLLAAACLGIITLLNTRRSRGT